MEAFASRDFRRFQLARVAAVLGYAAQSVAVAWQVYEITHRAIDLGYTGLVQFLPGVIFLLAAGHVADRFDRRQIILVCYALQALCTAALLFLARSGVHNVYPIFLVLFFIGTARTFAGPANSALIPHLVPEEHFVNAVTWGATIFQFATIIGPALGGVLFTLPLLQFVPDTKLQGPGIVYVFTLATLGWSLVLIASMRTRSGRMEHRALSLKVVLAGFQYMGRSPLLLGAASLDLFAVLLGGAVALTPIFANDILHTGPRGLGMLRAAPAAGAVTMSLLLARFPFRRHAGIRLFICVAIFGAATVVFGLSRSLILSLAALFIAGAADSISVIIRGSLLQLATPPEMRGRVSAVNSLFIGASNELGEFESGLTAQWWGAVRATVLGGIGAIFVAGLWSMVFPSLRRADSLTADELRPEPARD
jgi:MFS family permease